MHIQNFKVKKYLASAISHEVLEEKPFSVDIFNSKRLFIKVDDQGIFGYNENKDGFFISEKELRGLDYTSIEFDDILEDFKLKLMEISNKESHLSFNYS